VTPGLEVVALKSEGSQLDDLIDQNTRKLERELHNFYFGENINRNPIPDKTKQWIPFKKTVK